MQSNKVATNMNRGYFPPCCSHTQRWKIRRIRQSISSVVISPVMSPGWWMVSRKTGVTMSSPLFSSNTPDTAFSFVPAVTYCPTKDSPTVAFIRRRSVWRVCCHIIRIWMPLLSVDRHSYKYRQCSLSCYAAPFCSRQGMSAVCWSPNRGTGGRPSFGYCCL